MFIGAAIYAKHARSELAIWIFAIVMLAIQMTNFMMPPPEESTPLAIMALSSYVLFAAAAGFVEEKWGQPASA